MEAEAAGGAGTGCAGAAGAGVVGAACCAGGAAGGGASSSSRCAGMPYIRGNQIIMPQKIGCETHVEKVLHGTIRVIVTRS